MKRVEDTIAEDGLPVNTIAFLNRGIEILQGAETNCALSLKGDDLHQFKKLLWLINQQVYGQMGVIDMTKEWSMLTGPPAPYAKK